MSISLTETQQKAISVAPITSAALSVCSGAIVAIYVIASKERRTVGYHRIILLISIHIICHASALCFGTTPIPAFAQPPIYGASGTFATCEAQGFVQLFSGIASMLYYCSLPLVIFSRMCSNFVETRKTRSTEVWTHFVCNFVPLIMTLVALSRDYINPVRGGAFCGLNAFPDGCLLATNGTSLTCSRGDHNVEKLQHLTVAVRLFGLAIACVTLLTILFRRGCHMENVKTVASFQAIVHFFALVLFTIIGLALYLTWMKRNDTIFPFKLYVVVISLWPCAGVIHLVAYFILRQTWKNPTPKLRMESNTLDTENDATDTEEGLGSDVRQTKRWSLSATETEQIRKRTQNFTRWSFSHGEQPKPSKVREAEQMQRLKELKNQKLEGGLTKNNNKKIFDGTNPSKRWSAFILPNDFDLDESEEDDEAKYYSDICQQEM